MNTATRWVYSITTLVYSAAVPFAYRHYGFTAVPFCVLAAYLLSALDFVVSEQPAKNVKLIHLNGFSTTFLVASTLWNLLVAWGSPSLLIWLFCSNVNFEQLSLLTIIHVAGGLIAADLVFTPSLFFAPNAADAPQAPPLCKICVLQYGLCGSSN
jgi:hypothetical protein